MLMNRLANRKRIKIDTDKYELSWHSINDQETYSMSVWESPAYVGPEAYNAGNIDFILNSNTRNDVRWIIGTDDGTYVCRRILDKNRVKFMP